MPLLGFSWGFTDTGTTTILDDIELLTESAWRKHLDVLRPGYPFWVFAEGAEDEHPSPR